MFVDARAEAPRPETGDSAASKRCNQARHLLRRWLELSGTVDQRVLPSRDLLRRHTLRDQPNHSDSFRDGSDFDPAVLVGNS